MKKYEIKMNRGKHAFYLRNLDPANSPGELVERVFGSAWKCIIHGCVGHFNTYVFQSLYSDLMIQVEIPTEDDV